MKQGRRLLAGEDDWQTGRRGDSQIWPCLPIMVTFRAFCSEEIIVSRKVELLAVLQERNRGPSHSPMIQANMICIGFNIIYTFGYRTRGIFTGPGGVSNNRQLYHVTALSKTSFSLQILGFHPLLFLVECSEDRDIIV